MNYKKLKLVDFGTFGRVYRIKCRKCRKNYACKKINQNKNSANNKSIWKREIIILFSINHPNLTFAKEFFLRKNFRDLTITMEYAEFNLKNIIDHDINLSLNQIKNVIKQLLIGVSTLHENWIIHRDIKTGNILLNSSGLVKICDFGLSRFSLPFSYKLTQGVVTMWYRAPELLLGQKIYSKTIDSWSIGCVMGELLGREVLFTGKSELDQLVKIFSVLGIPTMNIWIDLHRLSGSKGIVFPMQPYNTLKQRFQTRENYYFFDLLNRFLTYDPRYRITPKKALDHPFLKS